MNPDTAALTLFARRHEGLFRVGDAAGFGFGPDDLRHAVARGWADRPGRGVYRISGAPTSVRQQILLAAWSAPDGALASHRSAAHLVHLWSPPRSIEVLVERGRTQRTSWGTIHGSLLLPPSHRTTVDGIPSTTPARTVFDVAGVVRPEQAEAVLDAALNRGLCTLAEVQHTFFLLARRGRPGTATMRALLADRGVGYVAPASELERTARKLFAQAGLPEPRFEVDLGDEAWIGRVDCLWERERVVVELDGRRYHDGRRKLEADRQRDNRLMAAGWRVIRVTWEDLQRRPLEVIGWIRRALAATAA